MKAYCPLTLGLAMGLATACGIPQPDSSVEITDSLMEFVENMEADCIGGTQPRITAEEISPGVVRYQLTFSLSEPVQQDDWQIRLRPGFTPDFHWSPTLTPTKEHVVDQHSFRSPALIVSSQQAGKTLRLVPDLDLLALDKTPRWYLDLDATQEVLTLGMSDVEVREHVLFVRKPGTVYEAGDVTVAFYLMASGSRESVENPFRDVLAFMWARWGRERFQAGEPLAPDLMPYVEHTYRWAFEGWKDAVWQEFDLQGRRVGAPVFIVNQTQSPNYPGEVNEREFRSIWNQAWFSSLRSASGLYRYGRRTGNEDLLRRARMTKELALSAPMDDGLFPSVIATEMETVTVNGEELARSKGWETAFWGNSDRNPVNRPANGESTADVRRAPYHLLDMSFTATLMLRWYEELEPDPRLLEYAKRYADRLLTLQDPDGFFPAWLDPATGEPLEILRQSPETSMSATFLFELFVSTGIADYQHAAIEATDAVANAIVPEGQWEDFETYWSCSRYGSDTLVGRKVRRNDMFKQNNFSMFWTAEALLAAWKHTGEHSYLVLGQRVLDELLMTQASWQPPYMYVNVLGGFGVMNADGEWNDSRESLFSELIVRYGEERSMEEYVQRGLAAMRASFVMMYAPENPRTRAQWEQRHPFFGPEDFGFTMENYGHGGQTSPEGMGMGVFTIYDWGNGAAAEAYNRLLDHFGSELVLSTD